MRIVFAGTPPFAACALEAILAAGHDVPLVLTQPDRPAGRGLKLKRSAVGTLAGSHGIEVAQPISLKSPGIQSAVEGAKAEAIVVAAYGLILPPWMLAVPPRGCLNVHASLLPRWRGAAPIPRAIQAGDPETGISIMLMEAGLDTGPVLATYRLPILVSDTAGSLADRLSELGAIAIRETLEKLDTLVPIAQDGRDATYAAKISRSEAVLDWRLPAAEVDRTIRAFNPVPGAETRLLGETLKIWEAEPMGASGPPGQVLGQDAGRPVVGCGSGSLALTVIQRPGSRRMRTEEFLKGHSVPAGTMLGEPPRDRAGGP